MDPDDDNVINYGTPLATDKDEDEVPRKRPVPTEEQIVTDARGLRRFHGAFTGGFSAGYFNTVGTKEGWTPSTFQSSRNSRASKSGQKPEDFMDEEDLGQFGIAPRAVHVTKNFAGEPKPGSSKKRVFDDAGGHRVIPGIPPLKDFIVPARESAGVKILRKMGWKPGQGIGPRVKSRKPRRNIGTDRLDGARTYGCRLPGATTDTPIELSDGDEEDDNILSGITFAPQDVDTLRLSTAKDNYHGIGYTGLDRTMVLSTFSGRRTAAPPVRDAKKKLAIAGEAFGVGAYENEDENIYSLDDMSQYDFELDDRKRPKEDKRVRSLTATMSYLGAVLEGFHLATKLQPPRKVYQPPPLPRDYRPGRRLTAAATTHGGAPDRRRPMSASDRAAIVNAEGDSVLDLLRKEDRARLEMAISKIQGAKSSAPSSAESFRPFGQDADKQRRYELFTKLKESNKEDAFPSCQPRTMTEWERQREVEEFHRASAIYKPLSRDMASRFVSAKLLDDETPAERAESLPANSATDAPSATISVVEVAPLPVKASVFVGTRESFDWHPDRILCRRFNVPNPYPDSTFVGIPKAKQEKYSVYNFLTFPVADEADDPKVDDVVIDSVTTANVVTSSDQKRPSLFSCLDQLTPPAKTGAIFPKEHASTPEIMSGAPDDKRPPMDLFKAIFKDTDSESSSESEDDSKVLSALATDDKDSGGNLAPPLAVGGIFAAPYANGRKADDPVRPKSTAFGVFANLDLDSINVVPSPVDSGCAGASRRLTSVAQMVNVKVPPVTSNRLAEPASSIEPGVSTYGPRLPENLSAHAFRSTIQSSSSKSSSTDSKNWVEKKQSPKGHHKKHKKQKKKKHKHRTRHSSPDNSSIDQDSGSEKEAPLEIKILERLKVLKKHRP